MPIENRELAAGTRLVARYKKADRTCEVVETADGLRYRLDNGQEFKSLSSAGKAVTGGACNGWVFWSVEGSEKPKREPKAKADKPKKAKKESAAKKPAAKAVRKSGKAKKKGKAVRAAAASDASYGCGVCPETFPTLKKATAHAMTHTA